METEQVLTDIRNRHCKCGCKIRYKLFADQFTCFGKNFYRVSFSFNTFLIDIADGIDCIFFRY